MKSLLLSLLTTLSLQAADVAPAHFYVAPNGNDSASGTEAAPFATLDRARLAVREWKQSHQGPVLVYLRGGTYFFDQTVTFTLADSGTQEGPITYAAYPGETPVLSAGSPVSQLQKPTEAIKNLPAEAQDHILVADIQAPFKTLFDESGILPNAKTEMFISRKGGSKDKVLIPDSHFKNWSNPEELEVAVRPHHAWILNILEATSLDLENQAILTSTKATYASNPLHFIPKVKNCWVQNAIEELDEPGEWVVSKGKLYLWPREESTVYAPRLLELLKVEGAIDYDGPTDTPVTHLHFTGLTFKHGERYLIQPDDQGIQHDWDFIDKNNALVRFRGTAHCSIRDCHFLHSGSGAIRLDLHSIENEVSGNVIEHIGGSGIFLCGYGPGTKDVNHHNFISNNHIHHVGELYWHSPGILLSQSGENRISNNLIHHTHYTGLIISGFVHDFFRKKGRESSLTVRWQDLPYPPHTALTLEQAAPLLHTHDNLIEYNEIHHAMQKLGDGNAIYIRGAGAGNIIRRNYVHHLITPMLMQCAIRTDGGQRDTLISENIIYKCMSQGMLLKLNNRFENNIIADVLSPPRGYFLSLREGPLEATIQKNIFYASGEIDCFIHELESGNKDSTEDARGRPLASLNDAQADRNLYYSAKYPKLARRTLKEHQAMGKDLNGYAGDPLFIDPAQGNFALQPDSPALKLGFVPIDQSKIGLLK